jgi:hypothetical protein
MKGVECHGAEDKDRERTGFCISARLRYGGALALHRSKPEALDVGQGEEDGSANHAAASRDLDGMAEFFATA